jgi:hypothetical protein
MQQKADAFRGHGLSLLDGQTSSAKLFLHYSLSAGLQLMQPRINKSIIIQLE